ncbi:hypothetical protein niasHT_028406 [Heterodera trifolii]|uniref:Uncharacterized protein n=2 Tax=Heterodera trifolii TaxID=157864 RepID=A0ABD2JIK5_9BILA
MAAPSIRLITTSKAPAATGYSQAVLVNNQTLYVSGQTGMISGKTDVVPGGARAEAKQAMTNIGEILTYAGSSFKHVINCNIMVTNMNDFQDVNETFKNFFTADTYPARSFFQVVKLPKNALVMIDAVAVVAGQYIDHSVIAFFHANKHIWDRMGTNLELFCANVKPIWDVLAREILPIFATNIRHLYIPADGYHLDNLRRRTSPTLLTDCDQLNSIDSGGLFPDAIGDDGPNATAGQVLSKWFKWLHTPSKNAQPKRFRRNNFFVTQFNFFFIRQQRQLNNLNWRTKFDPLYGNTSCANLHNVRFDLVGKHCIGQLSPPAVEEEEELD